MGKYFVDITDQAKKQLAEILFVISAKGHYHDK